MTTWAANLASSRQSLLAYVTIVGVGDGEGLWRFSTAEGWSLSAGQGTWKPLLAEWPDILSQEVDPIAGGTAKFDGSLTLDLVDEGDTLTTLFRLSNQAAQTVIRSELSSSSTTIELGSTTGIGVGDMLYVGSEAMEVTSITDGDTLTASRGSLGTTGVLHPAGAGVYLEPRLLGGRRMDLYLAALDAGEANDELVGSYIVDAVQWDEDHAVWRVKGRTRQLYLDRKCPREPLDFVVSEVRPEDGDPVLLVLEGVRRDLVATWTDQDQVAVSDGEEMLTIEGEPTIAPNFGSRGVIDLEHAGSKKSELEPGDYRVVMSAANGDFRVADGATTGTRVGWTASTHVVDILLAILTSPTSPDETGLNNADATYGNWSGLPGGYGLSVPVADIDVASFVGVRQRWRDAEAPDFVLGLGDTRSFREVADELLKPLGWYITQERGLVRLVAPKLPDGSAAAHTIGTADILIDGDNQARFRTSMAYEDTVSAYVLKFGRRGAAPVTYSVEQQLQRLFNAEDLFQLPSRDVELEVPHVRRGAAAMLAYEEAAQARLALKWLAYVRGEADLDPENAWDWLLGEDAALTMPGVVDPVSGVRGLTGATAQLTQVEPTITEDEGLYLRAHFLIQPSFNISKVAPAAIVTAVSGAGPYVCTVAANRYTDTDVAGDLPTEDNGDSTVSTFQVGDIVRLKALDRSYFAGTAEVTAVSTGSQTITLDANFSGNLAANTILTAADADNATAGQLGRYAFMASRDDYQVGATSEDPAVWGQR